MKGKNSHEKDAYITNVNLYSERMIIVVVYNFLHVMVPSSVSYHYSNAIISISFYSVTINTIVTYIMEEISIILVKGEAS